MKENFIKEKGFISIFVTLVMIFLLVFVLVSYNLVLTRLKNQKLKTIELQEIYSESFNNIEDYVYANANDIIPIYNIKELNRVGKGDSIQIKDTIYQCGIITNIQTTAMLFRIVILYPAVYNLNIIITIS